MIKFLHFILFSALFATTSQAATTIKDKFEVRMVVEAACEIFTQDLDFGTWGLLNSNVQIKAELKVTCTSGTPFSITIDGGNSGEPYKRYMVGGKGEAIQYNIYLDSSFKAIWGSDMGVNDYSGKGSGNSDSVVLYGQMPSQTTPRPSNYFDKLTATINY